MGSLEPIRDALAEIVSKNRSIHQLVERPESLALIQVAEPAAAESVHSLGAESDPGEDEMVTRRVMTIDRFMLGARPTTQQQEPQGKDSTPPPPPPLAAFGKYSAPSSNHLWVQGMPPQELPPECPGGSLSENPVAVFGLLHRLGLMSRPIRSKRWVGRPPLGSAMSPFLCQPTSKLGRRERAVELLGVWCKAFFCSRTCTSFRAALMSHWLLGCCGTLLR